MYSVVMLSVVGHHFVERFYFFFSRLRTRFTYLLLFYIYLIIKQRTIHFRCKRFFLTHQHMAILTGLLAFRPHHDEKCVFFYTFIFHWSRRSSVSTKHKRQDKKKKTTRITNFQFGNVNYMWWVKFKLYQLSMEQHSTILNANLSAALVLFAQHEQ